MTAPTAEQVIVGKMSLPQANGQITAFDLPQSFVWLKHLDAEEIAEFFKKLFEAINQSHNQQNWTLVEEMIDSWRETANIKADPDVTAGLEKGSAELERDDSVSWTDLRQELGL